MAANHHSGKPNFANLADLRRAVILIPPAMPWRGSRCSNTGWAAARAQSALISQSGKCRLFQIKKEGITQKGNVLFTPYVHYFRVKLWNHASPSSPPTRALSSLVCSHLYVHLAQNESYFILLHSRIQGHRECHFNNIPVVFPVNSKANLGNYYVLVVYFQVFIDSSSFGYLKRAGPPMSHIIRFFFFFFLLPCLFLPLCLSCGWAKDNRRAAFDCNHSKSSSGERHSGQPSSTPPGASSPFFPVLFMSRAHTPLNEDFIYKSGL